MPSLFRGSNTTTASGSFSSHSLSLPSGMVPTAQSYVLVAIGLSQLTFSVTGITGGTGTFVRLTSTTSATRALDLWVGYNFGTSVPSSITIARQLGTSDVVIVAQVIDVYGDLTSAPSPTASTANTATSTSADSGSLTPAVGDMLFAATVKASTSASTARTHTGNTYLNNTSASTGSTSVECGWGQATAATSSKEVWTVSSMEWAARQAMWTPAAAPAATAALVTKGLDTAASDAASSY